MKEIHEMTAVEISEKIKCGELGAEECAAVFLDRAEKYDGVLNCFTYIDRETVLKRAAEVQKGVKSGRYSGRLAGAVVAVKDNICVKDMPASCGSKILKNFTAPYNAAVINRLEDEGVIVLGKTNMDEFAMGSTTETSYFGPTLNPWDLSRVPGGSSGGSAACVSAGLAPLALGTDTGGSIRQPCSFCGVSGLKPTYSAVSRFGLIAYASSFDQIGPIAKNIDDCAALYSVICGKDFSDSTSSYVNFDYGRAVTPDVRGKKIGVLTDFSGGKIDAGVKSAVLKSAEIFEELGAEVEEISMPCIEYCVPAYYILACAQASSNLARYDAVKFGFRAENCKSADELYIKSRSEGFGIEAKRRIMLGNFLLSAGYYETYYKKALKAREYIKNEFLRIFENFDLIITPVAPSTAPKLGASLKRPLEMYLADAYTAAVNLASLPACACPCGFDPNNLPIGFQLIGKPFSEEEIIGAARAFEEAAHFYKNPPVTNLSGGGSQ